MPPPPAIQMLVAWVRNARRVRKLCIYVDRKGELAAWAARARAPPPSIGIIIAAVPHEFCAKGN